MWSRTRCLSNSFSAASAVRATSFSSLHLVFKDQSQCGTRWFEHTSARQDKSNQTHHDVGLVKDKSEIRKEERVNIVVWCTSTRVHEALSCFESKRKWWPGTFAAFFHSLPPSLPNLLLQRARHVQQPLQQPCRLPRLAVEKWRRDEQHLRHDYDKRALL
jgi:hypothetical protein